MSAYGKTLSSSIGFAVYLMRALIECLLMIC